MVMNYWSFDKATSVLKNKLKKKNKKTYKIVSCMEKVERSMLIILPYKLWITQVNGLAKHMHDSNKIYRQKSTIALYTDSYPACLKTSTGKNILIHKTAYATIDSSNIRLQISKPESDSSEIELSAIGLAL